MRAGRLHHRITIQRRDGTDDSFGEDVPHWTAVLSRIPALVVDESAREFTANLQVKSEKTVRVSIRDPRIEINSDYRIIWHHSIRGDVMLDISAPLAHDNRLRELTLICTLHANSE